MSRKRLGFYCRVGKRAIDLAIVLPGALIALPVGCLVGLLVRLKLGSPVLFYQTRAGKDGKPFTLFKFRTMTEARDEEGHLLPDELRLTPFGRFLRRSSLDELPELWNVFRGDMSVVGPRPLLVEYVPRYSVVQRRRLGVRPGLTGLPQVSGRNLLTWEGRFELDVWYVDHVSLRLDIMTMIRTLGAVFTGTGVSAEGHATMPEFTGNSENE